MAKMNATKSRIPLTQEGRTMKNHEGAVVHELRPLEVLFSKVLGSFFGESTHYEKRTSESDYFELVKLINKIPYSDREYVLKIAMLGREYNMIQYPLAVLTACFNDERFKGDGFKDKNGKNKLQYYSDKIVRRGMDIVDVMSLQINAHGFEKLTDHEGVSHRDLPLPSQLRKAMKRKLETFSEYQLSKALAESREVSLADCVKLLRPCERCSRVSKGFYSRVISGDVNFGGNVKQVQSELSKSRNSNSSSTVKDVADSLDTSTVMAIVKNLVALSRAGVFDDRKSVDTIVSKLTDSEQIRKSRLLPFRFYSAWKEVNSSACPYTKGRREISDALIEALDLSIQNMPDLEGHNVLLIDTSISMNHKVSENSVVTASEIATLLGAVCIKKSLCEVFLFSTKCIHLDVSKKSTVMDIVNTIERVKQGGCTNLRNALIAVESFSRANNLKFDNMLLLTDNDCHREPVSRRGVLEFSLRDTDYLNSTDSFVNRLMSEEIIGKLYLNNLLGNNFSVVNTDDFRKNLITGFSERIIETINIYDCLGKNSSDIKKVVDYMVSNLHQK